MMHAVDHTYKNTIACDFITGMYVHIVFNFSASCIVIYRKKVFLYDVSLSTYPLFF